MATVYLAHDLRYDRPVAFKLLRPEVSAGMNVERFRREIATAARLQHPHICSVYDSGEDDGRLWFTMPYVRGETLRARLKRESRLPVADAIRITRGAAEALAHAHRAGIVHRDVKPENVFLVDEPKTFVKMLDFGVAKPMAIEECLDVDHLPAGTPQYMSPEHMFEPETTDERSDLFSLAAVAYFALTGRSPFEAESLEALYFAIEGAKFVRPSELRPELPEAVDEWFVRGLARDRETRFKNARELSEAFQEAVRAGNSSARIVVPDPVPSETSLAAITKSVPGLSRRRIGRRSVALVTAAAVAACMWIWRSGAEVTAANASTVEGMDGGVELTSAILAPANTTPAPAPTSTTARTTKKPPARPHTVVRPAAPPAPKTVETQAPAPPEAPATEALDPDQVTSSIKDLIGNAPKPDLDP